MVTGQRLVGLRLDSGTTCNGTLGWLCASLSLGFLLSTMGIMLGISVAE